MKTSNAVRKNLGGRISKIMFPKKTLSYPHLRHKSITKRPSDQLLIGPQKCQKNWTSKTLIVAKKITFRVFELVQGSKRIRQGPIN